MDVHCSSCNEPWSYYHLRHDEIWETDLPDEVKENFDGKLTPAIREAFMRAGWDFTGSSLYGIRRCPACRPEDKPDAFKEQVKSALMDVLGDDEDGLIAELEDLDL